MKNVCVVIVAFYAAAVAQVAAALVSISLVNADFENGAPGLGEEIPGWPGVGTTTSAGVAFGSAHSGDYSAILMSGTTTSERGIYQMTDYTIQEGDIFTLRFWSTITWDNAEITAILFYGNGNVDKPAYEMGSASNIPPGGWWSSTWTEFELTATAPLESVGQKLGVHFVNTGAPLGSWVALDDVSLWEGDSFAPEAPTNLIATSGDGWVCLDWADSIDQDLASYTVYRALTTGSNYTAIASGLTASTNTDDSVFNGNTYYYVVTSTDSNSNESAYSPEVRAVPSADIADGEYLISEWAIAGGTNLTLMLSNSVPGHLYWVLSSDTLSPPDWSTNGFEVGNGPDLQIGIPIDPGSISRFFKIDVERQ